jgi:hypothetical protein
MAHPPPLPPPKNRLLKRLLIGGAVLGGLGILLPFVPLAVVIGQDSWQEWQRCRGHREFDAKIWQDPILSLQPPYLRSCMVDDLLAQNLLTQKTKAEVIALLGEPEPQQGFFDYDLVYVLGPERSFISIDYEWLLITFDSQGRVSDVQWMTD